MLEWKQKDKYPDLEEVAKTNPVGALVLYNSLKVRNYIQDDPYSKRL